MAVLSKKKRKKEKALYTLYTFTWLWRAWCGVRAGEDPTRDRIEVCWGLQVPGSLAGSTPLPSCLALVPWILGNRSPEPPTGRQPVPSTYPEPTSQEKAEGTVPWDPHASTLWDPTARTVRAPTPPALLRCYPEGWGQRPRAAGFDHDLQIGRAHV